MYARLTRFHLSPNNCSTAMQMADKFDFILRSQEGFVSNTFLGDRKHGDYVCLSVWKTRENAEGAQNNALPHLQQFLKSLNKEPASVQFYEVYEPKTSITTASRFEPHLITK